MDVKKEFYGDGISKVHFAGGMVRLDFVTFQPDVSGNNAKPQPEQNFRLVMNLHGFLTTFDTMKKLADKMLDAGLLKKNIMEKLDD